MWVLGVCHKGMNLYQYSLWTFIHRMCFYPLVYFVVVFFFYFFSAIYYFFLLEYSCFTMLY